MEQDFVERVRRKAFELYLERNGVELSAEEEWVEAERILLAENSPKKEKSVKPVVKLRARKITKLSAQPVM